LQLVNLPNLALDRLSEYATPWRQIGQALGALDALRRRKPQEKKTQAAEERRLFLRQGREKIEHEGREHPEQIDPLDVWKEAAERNEHDSTAKLGVASARGWKRSQAIEFPIPFDELRHALFDICARAKAYLARQVVDVSVGLRHVARLHR
jgi:hypothetical protein